jgi:hypothetical protein
MIDFLVTFFIVSVGVTIFTTTAILYEMWRG